MVEPVQSRVLHRAARVVGGYGELQEPVQVFVKLVEILMDAGGLGRAPPV